MADFDAIYGGTVYVDEDAFNQAIEDFAALGTRLANLKTEIVDLLSGLKTGFDTPAGRQLLACIDNNLYLPLDAQKLVIDHISQSLRESKEQYEPLFAEYEKLQNKIKQYEDA